MSIINILHWSLHKGFGAVKSVGAKIAGVKRHKAERDLHDSAAAMDPFVGKREFDKGDLWREPRG